MVANNLDGNLVAPRRAGISAITFILDLDRF
jgi:hypothetical protein